MDELHSLLRRVRRAQALGRIGAADAKYITARLEQCEARIVSMSEINESGREEG
jgi:hypothetical protein